MNTHTILKMKSKILGPCKMSCGIQRRSLSQSLVYFYCYKSSGRFGVKHFCTVTSRFDFNCTVPNTFYRFFFYLVVDDFYHANYLLVISYRSTSKTHYVLSSDHCSVLGIYHTQISKQIYI